MMDMPTFSPPRQIPIDADVLARMNEFFHTHGRSEYNYVRDHKFSGCEPDHEPE